MWNDAMPAIADAGWRAVAPDFAGYGDSEPDPPGTWERHIESVERFRSELGIEECVLVVHDWGGLVGMRWACEHPDAVRALVISSTGFFPDGRWHGMAKALREPGTGEQLVDGLNREGFGAVMRGSSTGMTDEAIDEYWKAYADDIRRARSARAVPLGGLLQARELRPRRPGRTHAAAVGRGRRVRSCGRRASVPARAAGHGAGGGGWCAPLRVGGRARRVRRGAYRLPSPCSRLKRSIELKSISSPYFACTRAMPSKSRSGCSRGASSTK